MHNNLPDETQLANGQKFELLSLALLGVPSMAEKFLEVSNTLKQLSFDTADYVCMKFILLLNSGTIQFYYKVFANKIGFFSGSSKPQQQSTRSGVQRASSSDSHGILP